MRSNPKVIPITDKDLVASIPPRDLIYEALNFSDNILKLYDVETASAAALKYTYPFLEAVMRPNMELTYRDLRGLVDQHFQTQNSDLQVRVIRQRDSFENRLILTLNEYFQSRQLQVSAVACTRTMIDVINQLVRERLCQQ